MQAAYEIDCNNAMILNHMSDQYFKRWYPVTLSSFGVGAGGGGALMVQAQARAVILVPK